MLHRMQEDKLCPYMPDITLMANAMLGSRQRNIWWRRGVGFFSEEAVRSCFAGYCMYCT